MCLDEDRNSERDRGKLETEAVSLGVGWQQAGRSNGSAEALMTETNLEKNRDGGSRARRLREEPNGLCRKLPLVVEAAFG